MPESRTETVRRRELAAAAVGDWITAYPIVRPLAAGELREYDSRKPSGGWRLEVQFPDRMRRLDLLLPDGFPRRPPQVALVDRPKFMTWPHVDEDGVLCLLGDHAEIDFTRPVEVASTLLSSAAELVGELVLTGRPEDFRAEFNTYWNRTVPPRRPKVYSLLSPVERSRIVRVWRGRGFDLIGEQAETDPWLRNRFTSKVDTRSEAAAVVWLPRPLLPDEFPSKPVRVFQLAGQVGAGPLLERLVCDEKGEVVVFAAPTPNGPCFAAVTLATGRRYGQQALTPDGPIPGFRPGKAPKPILVRHLYGDGTALKSQVERADAPWVHGRGQDPRFGRLRNATVAVLGCGSVGAPTAIQLAGAGVGGLILVDPETLHWANVGRHPLGAPGVGREKATALAERIRSSLPHIRRVEDIDGKWPDLGDETLEKLAECDLIVSAIGNWAAEGALDEWHRRNRTGPIVYGWTEAHACAGHAVAIFPARGCLHCGFFPDGTPKIRVTNWPAESTLKQEPACGATYQPYGPIELGHIVSLLAETALDCLLGTITTSVRRTWVGRRALLDGAGGAWNPDWLARSGGHQIGGFVEEAAWPREPHCVECGRPAT